MKYLLTIILALTCTAIHAQSVIVKGTGAGAVHRSGTGAGSVRGVVIPAAYTNYSYGRFTVWNTNQDVVLDNDSGRTWARDANIDGTKNWTNAIAYCSNLTYAGYSSGWRLPSMVEFSRDTYDGSPTGLLFSANLEEDPILPSGHPFTNIQIAEYWQSTEIDANNAWRVHMTNGWEIETPKSDAAYVWPCRGP